MLEKIITFLKQSENYISGEEISRELNISRAGIWKYMQELRRLGYDIVAVPHLGYRLVSSPDKLLPAGIKSGLQTKTIGQTIHCLDATNSTMDEAFRLALDGAQEGTVVCAESQTKGRGRLGRGWVSPKGKGLYFSIILKPKLSPNDVSQLTLLSAVAIAEAIEKTTGVSPKIKWPNDLLVDNKKLVGILTELSTDLDRVKFVVMGVGINVNTTSAHLPPEATSLRMQAGKKFPRIELLQSVLENFERWYSTYSRKGFSVVIQKWKDLSLTLGHNIRITNGGEFLEGKAVDIDTDGGLLIRNDTGVIVKRLTGDVQIG